MHWASKKTLSGWHLWGIAVGLVISGEYFGWSYGWAQAGTLGFLVTTVFIAVMYTTFIFSFTELTTAIPHAGGPFAYSYRAFGPVGGYLAGFSTLIEFVFAPPAIALAIGAYLNVHFPRLRRGGGRRVLCVHGAEYRRSDDRRQLRARGDSARDSRAAGLHGGGLGRFRWSNYTAQGWAGADHVSAATWAASLPPCLSRSGFPRHRGRGHGGRGSQGSDADRSRAPISAESHAGAAGVRHHDLSPARSATGKRSPISTIRCRRR